MERFFGLCSFGDIGLYSEDRQEDISTVLRCLQEEAQVAEQVGVDFFNFGEHHGSSFAISCPEIIISSIASNTHSLMLGSSVNVLSTDNPVRLFERYNLLTLLYPGRISLSVGKGSFSNDFEKLGYDYQFKDDLFYPRLEKLLEVYSLGDCSFPISVGTNGTISSITYCVQNNLPFVITMLNTSFLDYVRPLNFYRSFSKIKRRKVHSVSAYAIGFIAQSDSEAQEQAWTIFRGKNYTTFRSDLSETDFSTALSRTGSLLVGSPQTVANKIVSMINTLGLDRIEFRYSLPQLTAQQRLTCINLYGTEVIPLVKKLLRQDH